MKAIRENHGRAASKMRQLCLKAASLGLAIGNDIATMEVNQAETCVRDAEVHIAGQARG